MKLFGRDLKVAELARHTGSLDQVLGVTLSELGEHGAELGSAAARGGHSLSDRTGLRSEPVELTGVVGPVVAPYLILQCSNTNQHERNWAKH